MRKNIIVVLIAILLVSAVQAGHIEWYQQTDCYERTRPNVEPCQQQYEKLRAAHPKTPEPVYDEPAPKEQPQEEEFLPEEVEDEFQPEEAEKPVATADNLEGEVWVVKNDGSRTRVRGNTVFYSGDTIESKEGSAMLLLKDGHKIIVGKNSQFILEEQNASKLRFGRIKALFSPNKRFTVTTPIAQTVVRGTEFILNHDQTTETSTLHLHEGEVEVIAGGETELVQAGTSIVVNGGITSTALSAEQWDALSQEFEAEKNSSNMIWIILLLLAVIVFLIRRQMKKQKQKTTS